MPRIAYGIGAYRRTNGNLPELRLINMFLEAVPAEETGAVLLSRKGLTSHSSPGAGPVAGIFRQDGVFGGSVFTVSGGELYRAATLLGTISGTGAVSMAADNDELAVTAGSTLYRYDTTNGLDAVTFPGSQSIAKILFHDGLFIAIPDGAQTYYWSAVLDADTWSSLDFASAERLPDNLRDGAILNDTLWLFGSETIEPHANTGDPDSPYQRFEQRVIGHGIHSTGAIAEFDNSLGYVSNAGIVYRLAETPERISDHGIEERIAESDTVSCFSFISEGHWFFCIRLDAGTWAYDAATRQWCEFQTYGRDNFRGRCAVMDGETAIFGDDEQGKTWTFDGYDDVGEPLVRLFTAGFPLQGPLTVDNMRIEANVGRTGLLSGQGSVPLAELRGSRDQGATWGVWRSADLGVQGAHRTRTAWRRLGMFDDPGALFECRVTDPVPVRVSGVFINEAGGGRSR